MVGKSGTDGTQDETMADTRSTINDEHTQIVAVKDKQIDLLSSMLAQKEVDLKNVKLSQETITKDYEMKSEEMIN
jgi:hypothetical protein